MEVCVVWFFIIKAISFNLKGLGSLLKRKEILKLVRKENFDFLFIQETKIRGG